MVAPSARTSKRVYKDVQRSTAGNAASMAGRNPYLNLSGDIENSGQLRFKYALLMDVPVEALNNLPLLGFMEEWYGTPYRYGGATKDGIDCSAFTARCLLTVFSISIPRTVKEQYQSCRLIEKSDLMEGDLVFFHTRGKISHVGIYLGNYKFIHAATSSGVMISDLNDDYFSQKFAGAGRVR